MPGMKSRTRALPTNFVDENDLTGGVLALGAGGFDNCESLAGWFDDESAGGFEGRWWAGPSSVSCRSCVQGALVAASSRAMMLRKC